MDSNILLIMSLLAAALSWWFTILIKEETQVIKQNKRDELDKLERAERVKRLCNKA